jgi:hypothetical protein
LLFVTHYAQISQTVQSANDGKVTVAGTSHEQDIKNSVLCGNAVNVHMSFVQDGEHDVHFLYGAVREYQFAAPGCNFYGVLCIRLTVLPPAPSAYL